jgi:hypothetical protein
MKKTFRHTSAILLLGALALALCYAQEPTLIRLSDAVGNTIDQAERDSFRLFPNTAGFSQAVVLALPGPEYYTEVTLASGGSARQVFFRLMPTQLERIRFLIDNRDYMTEQLRSDSSAARTLAAFWQAIEEHPLPSLSGAPADGPSAARPGPSRAVTKNRGAYTLRGAALGSCAGGCVGFMTSVKNVGRERGPYADCPGDGYLSTPVYSFDGPLFLTVACGLTALGSVAGYFVGDQVDREATTARSLPTEGSGRRTCYAIGAAIPGLLLGTGVALIAGRLHYGKTENDPGALTVLPGVITGLCVAVEVTTIGYRVGRAIDRKNAEKAAAKRRALGR